MFSPCNLVRCSPEMNVVVPLFPQIHGRVLSTVNWVIHVLEPHTYISYKVNTL